MSVRPYVPRSPLYPLERRHPCRRPRSHPFLGRIPAPPRTTGCSNQGPPRRRQNQRRHHPHRSLPRRQVLRRRHRPYLTRWYANRRRRPQGRSADHLDHQGHLRPQQPRDQDPRRRPKRTQAGGEDTGHRFRRRDQDNLTARRARPLRRLWTRETRGWHLAPLQRPRR